MARSDRGGRAKGPAPDAPPREAFAAPDHDHDHCRGEALVVAEAQCRARGVRLTPQRRRVLELVWNSHAPVGAYALLDRMRDGGARAQPPTVYRALDFLVEHGLVHRIESLNAYVGCAQPARSHVGQFLICTRCRSAAELDDPGIAAAIARRTGEIGFSVSRATVEIAGLCPNCRAE
jgi:Fur family zinc uptake transcriptional regulator